MNTNVSTELAVSILRANVLVPTTTRLYCGIPQKTVANPHSVPCVLTSVLRAIISVSQNGHIQHVQYILSIYGCQSVCNFFNGSTALRGVALLIDEVSRSHWDGIVKSV